MIKISTCSFMITTGSVDSEGHGFKYLNLLSMNSSFKIFPLAHDVPDDEECRQIVRQFFDFDRKTFDVLFDLVERDLGLDLLQLRLEGVDLGQGLLALPGGRERRLNLVARNLRVCDKIYSWTSSKLWLLIASSNKQEDIFFLFLVEDPFLLTFFTFLTVSYLSYISGRLIVTTI